MTDFNNKTWTAYDPVTAAQLNTHLRDNLEVLKRPQKTINLLTKGANITTVSTSPTAVESPGLFGISIAPSILSGTCDIDVWMSFALKCSSGAAQLVKFTIYMQGAPVTAGSEANMVVEASSSLVIPIYYRFCILNVTPGAKGIYLVWQTSGGLTATIYTNPADANYSQGQFGAREV